MRRLTVFLLLLSFCLPLLKAGGSLLSSASPSIALHTLLHEHDVGHHHESESHHYQVGASDEADRHLAETVSSSHCCSLLTPTYDLKTALAETGRYVEVASRSPPDPDPDRLYRPPQA